MEQPHCPAVLPAAPPAPSPPFHNPLYTAELLFLQSEPSPREPPNHCNPRKIQPTAAPDPRDDTLTVLPGSLVSLFGRIEGFCPQLPLKAPWGRTHQPIAGAERGQPALRRPASHLPEHVARVVRARLDPGARHAPEAPLADEARGQQVPVEAQVEPQGLPSVVQLVEGRQRAPGERRAPVQGAV